MDWIFIAALSARIAQALGDRLSMSFGGGVPAQMTDTASLLKDTAGGKVSFWKYRTRNQRRL
jgi:hypothetical protein